MLDIDYYGLSHKIKSVESESDSEDWSGLWKFAWQHLATCERKVLYRSVCLLLEVNDDDTELFSQNLWSNMKSHIFPFFLWF